MMCLHALGHAYGAVLLATINDPNNSLRWIVPRMWYLVYALVVTTCWWFALDTLVEFRLNSMCIIAYEWRARERE